MENFFTDLKNIYFEDYLSLIKTTIDKDKKKLDKVEKKMKKEGVKVIETEDSIYDPYDVLYPFL